MKYNENNEELKNKIEQIQKGNLKPEDFFEYLVKKIENKEGLEYLHVLHEFAMQGGNINSSFDALLSTMNSEAGEWLSMVLYWYLKTFSIICKDPNELISLYLLINNLSPGNPQFSKELVEVYMQSERYEESINILNQINKNFSDLYTENDILTRYVYSGIKKYQDMAYKKLSKINMNDIPLEDRVGLGSTFFYSGHIYEGLIHHFGGEDFRPAHLLKKKEIPNGHTADFNDKKVLLTTYRGMGDSMILSRFIPKFVKKFPEVRLFIATENPMIPLYEKIQGVEQVSDIDGCIAMDFDYVLGVNILSRYLRDELVDENDSMKYHEWVAYDESYDQKWKEYVDNTKTVVGINWKGSQRLGGGPPTEGDKNLTRDVPFEDFIKIVYMYPNYQFICLNPDINDDEMKIFNTLSNVLIPKISDFGDTAALINLCDVVLSIDTAVSTLSASLSKDTIIMGKYLPDYRWGHYEKWWDLSKFNIYVYKKQLNDKEPWTGVILDAMLKLKDYTK